MIYDIPIIFGDYLLSLALKQMEADIEENEAPAPMYRLVLAGDAGAGKSSFLLRLSLNEFRGDIQTTLGEYATTANILNKLIIQSLGCQKHVPVILVFKLVLRD